MFAEVVALLVALVLLAVVIRWQWGAKNLEAPQLTREPSNPVQLVHKMCPHNNVLQSYPVENKDSLDEHLDVLARKLAEKEGRLQLSKTKIRETQHEIENLHAIDSDVRKKYRNIMESLRKDLLSNETECKKIQEQIEWVSRRRAELRDEVRHGQRIYGEAAADLAANLTELHRGRVTEKHADKSNASIRQRNNGLPCPFPRSTPAGSIVIKSSPVSSEEPHSRVSSPS